MSTDKDEKIIIDNCFDDRYSRLRLIPWWDQDRLKNAKVLVVGAGALGNEILKNLALLGFGNILIIDIDNIENSNLSRSILYREKDEGYCKAQVAANSVKDINPDCTVHWLKSNVVYDLGLGVYRWADVVFGGLDNREARLAINQGCCKVSTPWIDGAIEVMFGTVKVFIPHETACYECTMNEVDKKLLNIRRSCAMLSRKEMLEGKVPTTPTLASIIAGIQVQEALKLIHDREELPTLSGKGLFFNGLTHDSYVINYTIDEDCLSHEHYPDIKEVALGVKSTSLKGLLQFVRKEIDENAVLELERDIIYSLKCNQCNTEKEIYKSLGKVSEDDALCPKCSQMRIPEMTHTINGSESFLNFTLEELGIPGMEVFTVRTDQKTHYIELTGDRQSILGELSNNLEIG